MNYHQFTSESVCAGHPDKICDAISDAILDACLKVDPHAHTGIECLATTQKLVIAGEVKTKARPNYKKIAREIIKKLGYTKPIYKFDYKHVDIECLVHEQSCDISQSVDVGGAGDQGMMFGYACRETKELMPAPIMIAHHLAKRLDEVREKKIISYLRPDGKSEITLSYEKGKPKAVKHVVLAVAHQEGIENEQIKQDLFKYVVTPVLNKYKLKSSIKQLVVNGGWTWHIGGPHSDSGVTGRKIVVDTYGGMARVGGGALSGKCPTKVDRSGAYACRFLAKNIVAAGLADRAEVKVAYVIGQANPLDRGVETFGTAKKPQKYIEDFAFKLLDMSLPSILKKLNLRRPIYQKTATYGHFGRDSFPWEKIVV